MKDLLDWMRELGEAALKDSKRMYVNGLAQGYFAGISKCSPTQMADMVTEIFGEDFRKDWIEAYLRVAGGRTIKLMPAPAKGKQAK